MSQPSERGLALLLPAIAYVLASVGSTNALALESTTRQGTSSSSTEIPTEQSIENLSGATRHLIDAVRRLHNEAGLILSRAEIYTIVGVQAKPHIRATSPTTGAETLYDNFPPQGPFAGTGWSGELRYQDHLESQRWGIVLEFRYRGSDCISSRDVESYWGKAFAYSPLGVHALLEDEVRRLKRLSPTGPHDGIPYYQHFNTPAANKADVVFAVGRGACISGISVNKIFKNQEHSNGNVYYK